MSPPQKRGCSNPGGNYVTYMVVIMHAIWEFLDMKFSFDNFLYWALEIQKFIPLSNHWQWFNQKLNFIEVHVRIWATVNEWSFHCYFNKLNNSWSSMIMKKWVEGGGQNFLSKRPKRPWNLKISYYQYFRKIGLIEIK